MEDQATDLEVFEAVGVKGEDRRACSGRGIFPPVSGTYVGKRELLPILWSWKQPEKASSQNWASAPLQQLFQNTLTISPPLTGEEPWLLAVAYKNLFIVENFKHIQSKQKCIMNPQVLIGQLPQLSISTHSHDVYTASHSPLPICCGCRLPVQF